MFWITYQKKNIMNRLFQTAKLFLSLPRKLYYINGLSSVGGACCAMQRASRFFMP
jgi:hypothetical protein